MTELKLRIAGMGVQGGAFLGQRKSGFLHDAKDDYNSAMVLSGDFSRAVQEDSAFQDRCSQTSDGKLHWLFLIASLDHHAGSSARLNI
jgi:hypothetical protein